MAHDSHFHADDDHHHHVHHKDEHAHSHDHEDHTAHASQTRLAWAALLTAGFMIAEIAGGVISGSLALLADAAHMLTDSASLALAWFGFWIASKPSDARRSFGFGRFRILAAFANGLTLILLSIWIIIEAIGRFIHPTSINSDILMGVAIAGLLVNIIAFFILHGGDDHDHKDVNMQGAIWHVAGDMLGSVVAIIAALVIRFTGWMPIDPLLSMLVAIIIGYGGYKVIKRSAHILLEGVPDGFDETKLADDLIAHLEGVCRVHHIHAWTLTGQDRMVTLHLDVMQGFDTDTILKAARSRLQDHHKLSHVTIEICQDGNAISDCLPNLLSSGETS